MGTITFNPDTLRQHPAPLKDMVWIPGGTFLHGLGRPLPGGSPGPPGDRLRVLDRPHPGHQRRLPPLRQGHRLRHGRRAGAGRRRAIRAPMPEMLVAGSVVFTQPPGACRWTATTPGGTGCPGPTGGTRRAPAARSTAGSATRCCTSPGRMSPPTPRGPGRRSRPRRSGSTPAAAGTTAGPTPGAQELAPKGKMLANYWQGEFPWQNLALDGYERTAPVGSFPPNGYGLFDMIGNAWEWTADWYATRHEARSPCCGAARQSTRRQPGGERRSRRGRGRHPAQGAQGGLLGLRRELLPALPPGGAHAAPHRHRHQPPLLPLRRPFTVQFPLGSP